MQYAWPVDPFGPVAEVKEAAGSEEQIIEALAGVEVVVTEMAALTRRVIESPPALRLIVVCRGGPVNVNLERRPNRAIPVCFSPARNAAATAEYTIGLLLAAMRHIVEGSRDLAAAPGGATSMPMISPERDGGKTAGLIGFGAVGSRVARVLNAFGARGAGRRSLCRGRGGRRAARDARVARRALPRAHILSLHARLTPETRHMVDRAAIDRLPDGAILVNAARGGLLDQDALCDALESGKLRAAALDVYDPEPPPPDHGCYTTPNLVLSPHLAGASRETAERAAAIAAAEVVATCAASRCRTWPIPRRSNPVERTATAHLIAAGGC